MIILSALLYFINHHPGLATLALSGCLVVYISMTGAFARANNLEDYFPRMRERSLAWLVGRFKVIGSEPASSKTYEGFVMVSRQGDRLFIKKR